MDRKPVSGSLHRRQTVCLARLTSFLFALLTFAVAIQAKEEEVWQIGKPDGSYDDLVVTSPEEYTAVFPEDVTFVVGKDDPSKSWSSIQPGPVDAWGGSKPHPFAILFNLPDKPQGTYRLVIHLQNIHSQLPPTYEISINGKTERMELPPGLGDEGLRDAAKWQPYTIDVTIPDSYLHSGENRIGLESVTGAWIVYDSVQLMNDSAGSCQKLSILSGGDKLEPVSFTTHETVGVDAGIPAANKAAAANKVKAEKVWQIGKFDGSHDDLAASSPENYRETFPEDVTFVVGKDDPLKSWSSIQPGPADVWGGSKPHPFRIVFNLPDKPQGACRLVIGLLNTHAVAPPTFEVSINGNVGSIELPAGAGDEVLTNSALGKPLVINVEIPAASLHSGENQIDIQPVTGAWILYDAVRLENDPTGTCPELLITKSVALLEPDEDAIPLKANEKVVWQIGTFDRNYDELAIARNSGDYATTFPKDVTFVAGKDDPSKSWSCVQPGPIDGWGGSRPHPFTIVFNLPDKPQGACRLVIGLVNTHGTMPPTYAVSVNGIIDQMKLPSGGGDEARMDPAKGKPYVINAIIPASYLHSGENRIVLESVAGAWILYDAVRLTNDPGAPAAEPVVKKISVTPTVCFVRRGSQLRQIVSLSAQCSAAGDDLTATVKCGSEQKVTLRPGIFGNASADIEVDEVTGPTPLEAVIESAGQTKTASCVVNPEKHWKLYVVPSAHGDLGYSDVQEKVIIGHNENMTTALDLCRKYPDFKWNTEAGWLEDNYLSMAPADRKEEFIRRAQEGRIGCQAIYSNVLTGISSHEGLIRNFYYVHGESKKHGIPFDIAEQNDVPTHSWGLPTVIAGTGIKYFMAAHNSIRGDTCNRLACKPFFWQGPDGSSVLTWFSTGYAQASALGLDMDIGIAKVGIDQFLRPFNRADYPYDAALATGGYMDNCAINVNLPSAVEAWNKTYEYPKVIFSRGPEFFTYLESNFRDKIPTIAGDHGVYWEDGAGSSAFETGISRCAMEDLAAAEKMFSLTSVLNGREYPAAALNAAWKDAMLWNEHTWGAGDSISKPESKMVLDQWNYKARFATESAKAATLLKNRGFDELVGLANVKEPSVVVFNPNSWPLTGVASLQPPDGERISFPADVPALGVKVYPLGSIPKATGQPSSGNVMENRFYRLEVDPATGAVKHLLDKELNRELVDPNSPYGLNQYLYVSGFAEAAKDVTHSTGRPNVSISQQSQPGCVTMKIQTSAFNTPSLATEIVLYDGAKRIDFLNTMEKTATYEKEAGYFAFPFSINKPRFYVAIPNGVVRPDKDMLDGGCMAWYCTQDFVVAEDDTVAVVWTAVDSPLVTLSDINREVTMPPFPGLPPLSTAGTKWPVPLDKGHVYGYIFNNYWLTNYKASQGGRLQFRFSLTSMKAYDAVAASRFGQSVRNPLLAKVVQPQNGNEGLPASLCSVSPDNVDVQAIKRAESGDGWIIRLRELGGKPTTATISLPNDKFKSARACNLVEDPQSDLQIAAGKVRVDVKANGMATVLVQ